MRLSRPPTTTDWKTQEVTITGLSHDGRGLARHQGKAVFVAGALEGEVVSVQPLKHHRKFIDAKARRIHQGSSERVTPECSHFGVCGGCSLQYWSHKGQLAGKQKIVLDQMRRFASMEPEHIALPLVSSPYGYRHRCRLAIKWKKNRLLLGFRESQSQAICEISHCPIVAEEINELPALLRDYLPSLKTKEAISHAELLLADNGRAVLLRHIRNLPEEDSASLRTFAQTHQLRLFLQDNDRHVSCLYSPDGEAYLYYSVSENPIKLCYTPLDFTQVNADINRQMVAQAIDWLGVEPHQHILDLFCGLGNFSLALARHVAGVTGVEAGESAVARATSNAALNGLKNSAFFQADLTQDFRHTEWAKATYDALLLDPPRAGAQEVITLLKKALPPKILYVSCNPATLARDAALLKAEGFILKRLGVMDMFPQTAHIESMALFER